MNIPQWWGESICRSWFFGLRTLPILSHRRPGKLRLYFVGHAYLSVVPTINHYCGSWYYTILYYTVSYHGDCHLAYLLYLLYPTYAWRLYWVIKKSIFKLTSLGVFPKALHTYIHVSLDSCDCDINFMTLTHYLGQWECCYIISSWQQQKKNFISTCLEWLSVKPPDQ